MNFVLGSGQDSGLCQENFDDFGETAHASIVECCECAVIRFVELDLGVLEKERDDTWMVVLNCANERRPAKAIPLVDSNSRH